MTSFNDDSHCNRRILEITLLFISNSSSSKHATKFSTVNVDDRAYSSRDVYGSLSSAGGGDG